MGTGCRAWRLAALLALTAPAALAQTFQVTSTTPAAHAVSASTTAPFEIQFSQAVDPATWGGITVFASGKHAINTKGTGSNNGRVVVTLAAPLRAGEEVSITVPASVRSLGSGGQLGTIAVPQYSKFQAKAGGSSSARLVTRFQPDQHLPNLADATLADVDNDGDLDALACDNVLGQVNVLLNDGAGHLLASVPRRRAVPLATTKLECADLDNDGDLDLLGLRPGGGGQPAGVWVSRNDGTGTFGAPAAVGSNWGQPTAMCVGDFDADGDLDLAVADAGASVVKVGTNNSGNFLPTDFTTIACTGYPADLTCTDIDNDGDLDLLAACRDTGEIAILLWQLSQWTASPRIVLPVGSNPGGIATGDLNGDGVVGMVVSGAGNSESGGSVPPRRYIVDHCPPPNQTSWCVYWLPEEGKYRRPPSPLLFYGSTVADLDGDGDLDILCPDGTSGVTVYRNSGSGTFSDGADEPNRSGGDKVYCWGQGVARVCAGDLDNDGDMDAIAVCIGSGDVASLLNQEPVRVLGVSPRSQALVGGPRSTVSVTYSTPVDATSFALSSSYRIRKIDRCPSAFTTGATGSSTDPRTVNFGFAAGSITAAGYYQSVVGNNGNAADGRLLPPMQWNFDTRPSPSDGVLAAQGLPLALPQGGVLCPADFDGDGLNDLVSVTAVASIYKLEAVRRLGSGSYAAAIVSTDSSPPTGYTPALLRCADVNDDGLADAVVVSTNGTDSYCSVYVGSATGAFTKLEETAVPGLVTDLALADLDANGGLEAVMAIPASHSCARRGINERGLKLYDTPDAVQTLAFVPGDPGQEGRLCTAARVPNWVRFATSDVTGDLHFEATPSTLPDTPGDNLTLADFDGDSRPDVVVPLPSANGFKIKLTVFDRFVPTGSGSSPTRAYAGDLDGDGDRDLLALCPGNNTLWVGLNDGTGAFGSSYTVAVPASPVEAWVGDCDGDGIADVLVRCADNTVRLLECGPPAANDLFITTTQTIPAGTYHNVTILDGGDATCAAGGPVTCTGQMTVANGGSLHGPVSFTGAGALVVAPGATLYIDDAAGFSADGSSGQYRTLVRWTSNSWCSKSCAVVYEGTTPQVTGTGLPAQPFELTVASTGGLTLTNPTTITGRIVVKPGCVLRPPLPASAQLRIRSSADSTALVVNEGTGIIQGNVAVEVWASSHTTPNATGYRHLAPPTSNATVASLAASGYTPVCSAAYNTAATPGLVRPFPTTMYYDQSRQLTAVNNLSLFDKGWTAPAALTDALPVGRGIASNMPSDRRLTFTGPLNNGDISIALSRHTGVVGNAASGGWAGWALVGNPYPSPIDWSLVTAADRPGLDASIYAFENNGQYTGRYLSYVNGQGDLDPVLAMGQGFWVRVSSGQTSGSLTFSNSKRKVTITRAELGVRSSTVPRPTLRLALAPEATPAGLRDNLYVYVEAGATAGLDAEYDAVKLPNSTGLNLSAGASTGEALAIQGLPALGNAATVVPLTLGLPAAGRYTLTVGELANFAPGTRLLLRDQLLGRSTLLTASTRYDFSSTATTVAGRFFLDLAPASAPAATAGQLLAAGLGLYPNPAQGQATVQVPAVAGAAAATLTLSDALGRTVHTATAPLPATGLNYALPLVGLAPGVYALRVTAGSASAVRRLVVE